MAYQAPPSMGFSRQEYWNGLPFPSPGELPDPGIKPGSPTLAGGFFTTEPPGKPFPDIMLGYVPAQTVPVELILFELEGGWEQMKYK